MHMTHGRPQLFARKPAPVQVAWLAYPATTGIGAIDALFLDPRLAPPGCESEYSERVLRLPDTFWCYDPCAPDLAVNDLPATEPGAVTFGCLNAPAKITDDTLRLWTGVLRGAPHARLQIMVPEGGYRERLRARLAAAGIAAERVTFQPFQPRNDYLQTYREIDLGLDTFPYNGHTTSLDSLWMGVPVVSRVGRTAVGRAGLSQLFHLGLSEWAVETDEQYVALAVQWAHDLPKLAALRRDLRARMAASPLMDGRRFARAMEAAYRTLWREWCRAAT
jgi:predicted O-linked N-acetylglucosamine transferase (SPINDLY family)